jgi:hypothetical protein
MNPAIQYERARERQTMSLRDPRSERLSRRIGDPRLPSLAAELRDALLLREVSAPALRVAPEPG